jgi:formylglycine-generating enzyme required for sulfatase activity
LNWNVANQLCSWSGGRLPTEAEWEYAARAQTSSGRYDVAREIAWTKENSGGNFHEAAQKKPNNFGLHDMLGNVWEWTADWYAEDYYQQSPVADPKGPRTGEKRSLRGGSWYDDDGNARASLRGFDDPAAGFLSVGFRCVRDTEP